MRNELSIHPDARARWEMLSTSGGKPALPPSPEAAGETTQNLPEQTGSEAGGSGSP